MLLHNHLKSIKEPHSQTIKQFIFYYTSDLLRNSLRNRAFPFCRLLQMAARSPFSRGKRGKVWARGYKASGAPWVNTAIRFFFTAPVRLRGSASLETLQCTINTADIKKPAKVIFAVKPMPLYFYGLPKANKSQLVMEGMCLSIIAA